MVATRQWHNCRPAGGVLSILAKERYFPSARCERMVDVGRCTNGEAQLVKNPPDNLSTLQKSSKRFLASTVCCSGFERASTVLRRR